MSPLKIEIGELAGPKAETIVALADKHHAGGTGGLTGSDPLAGIQRCRVEGLWVLLSGTTFQAGECVDAKVKEDREIVCAPRELASGGKA